MTQEDGGTQLPMFNETKSEALERIKRLRLMRHWDQTTLATNAGLSAAAVSNIELGRVSPTIQHVEAISKAFGYSSLFITAELSLNPTTRPWLRAYADASKREADAQMAVATTAAEYIRRLGLKIFPDLIPPYRGSLDDEDAIEEAAAELRDLAQIDQNSVVSNAIRSAERVGCVVLPLESELGRHLGMSVRADEIPMICVAKQGIPGDRQRWTVAHELGHLTLHASVPPPRDAREAHRMEDQAHRFAAAFLTPADALVDSLTQVGGAVTLRALAELKAVWGVAIKSLVGRFNEIGIIEADHARSLYKQISARRWSKAEPVHVPRESAQWFEGALLRKAGTRDLTAACYRLAEVIGGNAQDLSEFANWNEGSDATILYFPVPAESVDLN